MWAPPSTTDASMSRWAHARRPFFAMADIEENARRKAAGKKEILLSPIAIEIARRIDALFAIERTINGKSERLAVRRAASRPLVDDLETYMREQAARPSRGHDLARAIQYMLKRWPAFTLFLDDGRVWMSTNAAERGPRGVATGLSLCTSFSSGWKHWKGPRRLGATRAPFPGDGRGDGLRMQVA